MTGEAIRVTKLERHAPEGARPFYTANVHAQGAHAVVNNRYGSWQAVEGERRRDVLPAIAAQLQARLPRAERGTR